MNGHLRNLQNRVFRFETFYAYGSPEVLNHAHKLLNYY